MGPASVKQMADRVAGLMEQSLGARGEGLRAKLSSSGASLPRKLRRQAEFLATSAEQAADPEKFLHLDHQKVALAYDACVRHLQGIGPWQRRMAFLWGFLRRSVISLLILAALVAAFLLWRGLI
jgi:hypothetical protein